MQQQIIHIESLELPELQPYRTLRRPLDHIKEGIFVAEGTKVVERLLFSTLNIRSILLTPEWFTILSSSPETGRSLAAIPIVFIGKASLKDRFLCCDA